MTTIDEYLGLSAGKGHEDYQILKNKVIKFDDFKMAKKIFNK